MSQESTLKEDIQSFLSRLRYYCGARPNDLPSSPGIRSALRRGASEGTRHLAYQAIRQCGGHIVRFNGEPEPCWIALGAAFAFYPQPAATSNLNFGMTCFHLAKNSKGKREEKSSFDARFRRVLGAESAADLAKWVVQIARRARTAKPKPAPLNYEELLYSMLHWDAPDRVVRERIRARWASAYWDDRPADDDESEEL